MLNQKKVNLDNSILLYEQVKMEIIELINSKNLRHGEKIPTESELGELFNVSRITIRRAIKELVEEGIIEVIRGKGTFVKAEKKHIHLLNLKGYTEGLNTEENNIEKEILFNEKIKDESEISKVFSYKYNEFVKLVRVVKDSEGPFSIDYAYLPLSLYPDIDELFTNNVSTFEIMKTKYNVEFTKVEKEFEYIQPSQEICRNLGISRMSPVILVKKVIYGSDHLPLHYSKYYLIGDRVKFYIEADYSE